MYIVLLIGRVIAGLYFLENAYNHLFKTGGLVGYASSKNVPNPKLAIIGSGVLLLLGGLALITGMYVAWGALLLVIFLIPVSFMMHAFWKIRNPQERAMERLQFMKNMALVGLLLMLIGLLAPAAV
ncbi:MAG TPA: DoxX family membrane protein [Candidatus Paceibacterota bacterium]|nr:DoxX family membrane protein [Candidatus Paceibacterota bacterium]